jgi:hypothetical protein
MIAAVVRQGPLPGWIHGLLEYLLAAALIVAPFALAFRSGGATAVAIVAGVAVLIVAATTNWSTSLVRALPVPVHILLDYVLAGVLIASPFLFGFSRETNPTAFFIAAGVVHLLVTIATRFGRREPEPPAGEGERPAEREQVAPR